MKKIKLEKFKEWQWLAGAGVAMVAHNLVSGLIGREEAVFFILTFVFVFGFLMSLINRLDKNNYWLTMGVMLILGLDWAALHDILNREPKPYGEYGILLVSGVIVWWLKKRKYF